MSDIVERIKNRWRRVKANKAPHSWELLGSAKNLSELAKDPWACQVLARALDIQIDPGECAATFVASMAQDCANRIRRDDALKDAQFYANRLAIHERGDSHE